MPEPGERARVIGRIADYLIAREVGHPLRVAVDGITASGKTTLADELAATVEDFGRPAVRISGDDFHHQRERRYRQGRSSAQGYYDDAYDYRRLADLVLLPLVVDGSFRRRSHDLASDELVDDPVERTSLDAVVIIDGSFLQRPELAGSWDQVVFVRTDAGVALARGMVRDADQFGGPEPARRAYEDRYHAAGRIYFAAEDPITRATVVVNNDDLDHPILERIGVLRGP